MNYLNDVSYKDCVGKVCKSKSSGDSFEINIDSLLRVLPQVVPLYSRQRLYIHAFKSNYSNLWKNAQVYMTKGYTGNTVLSRPILTNVNLPSFVSVEPGSLFDHLGLPIGMTRQQIINAEINALPFMMYTRIYRDYFLNKNFYTTNLRWLPNDDHDFMLDNNGNIICNNPMNADGPQLGIMYYRDYPQDYFTSALPFPQRGDTPTLSFNLSFDKMLSVGADVNLGMTSRWHDLQVSLFSSLDGSSVSTMRTENPPLYLRSLASTNDSTNKYIGSIHSASLPANADALNSPINSNLVAKLDEAMAHSSITLNQLRELSLCLS